MPERGWYGGQKRTHQPTHPRRAAPIQQYSSSCVSTNRVAVSYTHRRTNLPTHDVLQQYSSTAADALAQTEMVCLTLGFPLFDYSPPFRGASDPSPGGSVNTPARRAGHGRSLFCQDHRGLLCGAGIVPTRDRGRPGGARDSQLFLGHVTTKCFQRSFCTLSLPLPRSIL